LTSKLQIFFNGLAPRPPASGSWGLCPQTSGGWGPCL